MEYNAKFKEFTFRSNFDGMEIFGLVAFPVDEIKGAVQIVHGMCEHKERYKDFMAFLAHNGYMAVIHDNRGHGKSIDENHELGHLGEGGSRALVEDAHQLTVIIRNWLTERNLQVPITLLGHSMGSLVVRCYLRKYDADIDKLVVVGSPSKPAGSGFGKFLAKGIGKFKGSHAKSSFLDKLVNGAYEKRFFDEGEKAWVCANKDALTEYRNDPLCGYSFTVKGYEELIELTLRTYSNKGWGLRNTKLPIIYISGEDDPCNISPVEFKKSVNFMKETGYENVQSRLHKGMRHEVLNETEKNKIYREVLEFVQA